MNPERLLQHFDRIADAPDAVPRIRRFILDLAVRGKLVEQNPNDAPVSELLKQIQAEKMRLVREGKIRRQDALPPITEHDQPFFAPTGWCWERLANISRKIHYGFTASANSTIKAVRLLRITDIQDNSVDWDSVPGCEIADEQVEQFNLKTGDIVIARTGGTIGKSFLVTHIPVTAVFASYLIRVQGAANFYDRYLKLFAESPVYWKQLEDGSRGAGQPNVNGQTLGKMAVPIPPLAEQHRIVAKVDELMELCDQLEAAQAERDRQRDRLVAASLHCLNQPAFPTEADQPDDFREHARFYFNHLPRLTTRLEHIKQLRETLLNLAVRGKLVPQDPNDEPVSTAIARLTKDDSKRAVRRGVPDTIVKPDLVDGWHLPSSWQCMSAAEMLRLGVITDLKDGNHGANHPKTAEFTEEGLPFITAAQVRDQTLDFAGAYKVSKEVLKRLRVGFAKTHDVIFTHKGSVGRVAIAPDNCILSPQTTYYRPNSAVLYNRYLMWFMASNTFSAQFDEVKKQTTRDFVPILRQYQFFHAIPPLAEQHRIVAKVDEVMSLCDQLEAQLTTAQADSGRLLEAVLHEALAMAV